MSKTDKRPEESYDEAVKEFLSIKGIIAYITKEQIKEYEGLSVEEVASLIEGDPMVSSTRVDDENISNTILGANTEHNSLKEGKVVYDVLTYIRSRDGSTENAIIVNLESQYAGISLQNLG